jgi:hypothetical protein
MDNGTDENVISGKDDDDGGVGEDEYHRGRYRCT